MGTAAQVSGTMRNLRVALVWNGTLQNETVLEQPQRVGFGAMKDAVFGLPDGTPDTVLLEPTANGYVLSLSHALGGVVWMNGDRHRVADLDEGAYPLGPDDYGVVSIGTIAIFYQSVRAARKPDRQLIAMDGSSIASLGLSLFLHAAAAVLLLLAKREMPEGDPLELPTDLIRRFMVTPPPEDIIEEQDAGGTDTEDPGLRSQDEMGGERAADEEGRVGQENAEQEDTEIAGENHGAVATKVRTMGLLGVLSGGGGTTNAISDTLSTIPSVSDMLSGMGAARTIVGRGSGGMGLRGTGQGGGGTGPGVLFGAGNVGTGVGAGNGSGLGRGSGGIGVKGRPRAEIRVSLQTAAPRVNGYLSAEQINRVVRANSAAIRYCYELEVQRQPTLRGRVEIQWRINLQGSVTSARVDSSTMHNAGVEGCMVRQIRRWRFDHPDGGEVVVTYPFIFGVSGG